MSICFIMTYLKKTEGQNLKTGGQIVFFKNAKLIVYFKDRKTIHYVNLLKMTLF